MKEFALTLLLLAQGISVRKAKHSSTKSFPYSNIKCEPGCFTEAFTSLSNKVRSSSDKKDCCLIIDSMSICTQTIWNQEKDQYSGFSDYGGAIPDTYDTPASETLVVIVVGTRSHWKCPIGYFLVDKISAGT